MKVFNLCCAQGHSFEGWFASEDDYQSQTERGLLTCPLCEDKQVRRLPSAPRLNLGATEAPAVPAAHSADSAPTPEQAKALAALQGGLIQAVREVIAQTEDVGQRFPEEARRIHYGEAEVRSIRGQASPEERAELADEGIEVFTLPAVKGLVGPTH
ncbi:MAG: DUF1178 domain-containing protein [Ideonella sp. MAG2]|nr:MAG: DUF1178 domain-containing protein [Ideonella sp. MAG2]